MQREVPFGFVIDATYVGRRGLYLQRERNINQLPAGMRNQNPGVAIEALRPYKGYGALRIAENSGRSLSNWGFVFKKKWVHTNMFVPKHFKGSRQLRRTGSRVHLFKIYTHLTGYTRSQTEAQAREAHIMTQAPHLTRGGEQCARVYIHTDTPTTQKAPRHSQPTACLAHVYIYHAASIHHHIHHNIFFF